MSKQQASKRSNLRPVDGEAPTTTADKPKRERKKSGPRATSYADQLRELTAKHRAKLGSLVDAEAKLEGQLAEVRRQREAAEGPLRDVEALLANHPSLPSIDPPTPEPTQDPEPVAAEGEVSP